MADEPQRTDYRLHSTEELREAIATARREEARIREEDSDDALEAERTQRRAMEAELRRRERNRGRRAGAGGGGPVRAMRSAAGVALAGTAAALALGAAVTQRVAELVRPGGDGQTRATGGSAPGSRSGSGSGSGSGSRAGGRAGPGSEGSAGRAGHGEHEQGDGQPAQEGLVTPPAAESATPGAGGHGAVRGAGTVDVPEVSAHERAAESHVAELAAGTADDVAGRVRALSTDELRALHEYETAHKNRRTVLDAIERAAASGTGGSA